MADENRPQLQPTGNVQIVSALRTIVMPELAAINSQLARIEKKLDEVLKQTKTKA